MEPYQHFLVTAVITAIIVFVLHLDMFHSILWVLIASFLGVLYDMDHLLYAIYLGKVKIIEVIKNPMFIFKIRRATGLLPPTIPTHNLFIALLLTVLSAIAVPRYAIPVGIGLTLHIICDELYGRLRRMKELMRNPLSVALLVVLTGIATFKLVTGENGLARLNTQPVTGFATLPLINAQVSTDLLIIASLIVVLIGFMFREILKKRVQ